MMITFYRTGADGGLRYYSLNDRQRHLFSRYSLSATWGRQLSTGRQMLYTFESADEMEKKVREIIKTRLRGGYKVLYSYFGKSNISIDTAPAAKTDGRDGNHQIEHNRLA